jgi:hypothetical protein
MDGIDGWANTEYIAVTSMDGRILSAWLSHLAMSDSM